MRPDDLAKALEPEKFRPFRINLTNGESYVITHPDQVLVDRSTAVIGTQRRNGTRIFERVVTCGLVHIVSMTPIHETTVE